MKTFLIRYFLFLSLLLSVALPAQTTLSGVTVSGITINLIDSDYIAILDRATALGYTLPSTAQQAKQNQLVINLKAAGIWPLLDILYIFATDATGGDFASLNWKAPSSYQITKVNTPTFTINEGFDFNGTTQYLNTNWIPGTNGVNYTLNDASAGCHINDDVVIAARSDIGCSNNSDGISSPAIIIQSTTNTVRQFNGAINDGTNTNFGATGTSIGFYHLKRLGVSGNRKFGFTNGSLLGSSTTVSTTMPTVALFIGAANGNGTAVRFSTREISMAFAGSSLDGKESAFYTHWNTYFTGL